jgi:hypothetical protein
MTPEELAAAQALSQEIDRGFPAIPPSQLDDLIPFEDEDEDETDVCPECEGDGLVIVGWDDFSYENIEGNCPSCGGSGVRKELRLI